MQVAGIAEYTLIYEPDAVAIEYGYYKNLSKEFDAKPLTVLFVGVGFAASQAFIVQYTKVKTPMGCNTQDHFKILHYASSQEVSSSKIDSILFDLTLQSYEDQKNPSDPDIKGDSAVYFQLFPRILKAKESFSHEGFNRVFYPL